MLLDNPHGDGPSAGLDCRDTGESLQLSRVARNSLPPPWEPISDNSTQRSDEFGDLEFRPTRQSGDDFQCRNWPAGTGVNLGSHDDFSGVRRYPVRWLDQPHSDSDALVSIAK